MKVINQYGRAWQELDTQRAFTQYPGSFSLVSEDGHPLCGRVTGKPEPTPTYVAPGWRAA